MPRFLDEILPLVEQPARYLGTEINVRRKEWRTGMVRFVLCYPDLYELGMSSLGVRILYGLLNDLPNVVCERAFLPALDMERICAERKIPLFTLESAVPLKSCDAVGISLSSELNFTSMLHLLRCADIPLLSIARAEDDPLVVVGGNSAFNPLPLAPFADVFVIGEGEEVLPEMMEILGMRTTLRRKGTVEALAALEGVYVPGVIRGEVRKRFVKDLDAAYFPVDWLVPLTEIIHDRISLEIMRGCGQGCLFCQAGRCWRPVRLRSPERIRELAMEAERRTGYEEISFLSFSSGDHPQIGQIVESLVANLGRKRVSFSFPSLRIDTFSFKLATTMQQIRKTGLTFAPETGERLRHRIGKNIQDAELLRLAEDARAAGWRQIKLYFMIGLPDETEDDIRDIVRLLHELSRIIGIKAAFNTFIPKPHTPFEGAGFLPREGYDARRAILVEGLRRNRYCALDFHPWEMSCVEAFLARGDERLAPVILRAWESGACRENWREHFNLSRWETAFRECGMEMASYHAPFSGPPPWRFIRA